jgi:hypothetical protein
MSYAAADPCEGRSLAVGLSAGCEGADGGIHDLAGVMLVEWSVSMQEPIPKRGEEQIESELDVGVIGQLPALDSGTDARPGRLTSWFEEAFAVDRGEGRVELRMNEQACHHSAPRRRPEEQKHALPAGQHVAPQRAGVDRLRNACAVDLLEGGLESEQFLGIPPAIDRCLRDAGVTSNLVERHRLQTLLDKQRSYRREDGSAGLFTPGATSPRRRGLFAHADRVGRQHTIRERSRLEKPVAAPATKRFVAKYSNERSEQATAGRSTCQKRAALLEALAQVL